MADAVKLVSGANTDPRLGDTLPMEISGLIQATAGSIVLYDGTDATGTPVLASAGIGTYGVNDNIYVRHGLYAVLTGGATGSVLTS